MQLTTNLKLKKPEIADAVNIDDLNSNADTIDTEVAKIASTSQAGRMSVTDKTKLDGIQAGAQVNAVTSIAGRTGVVTLTKSDVGLSSVDNAKQATKTEFDGHVADEVKHITAAERTSWNAKASTAAATSSAAGLMAAVDKSKLDGIAAGANNYVHPASHPASIITQDASNRFVTDAEKAAWNAKTSLNDVDARTLYGVTTGTATVLVLTLTPAPTSLYSGIEVKVKLHLATGENPTLNVNSLGAKSLKKANGQPFSGKSGQIYSLIYDGTNFIQVSGGGGDFNIFRQSAQPTTFNGVWIKDSTTAVSGVVMDNDVVGANSFSSDTTSIVAPMLTQNNYTVTLNGAGHVFYQKDTYRYNESNNTWTKLADKPSNVNRAVGAVNNIAYALGGIGIGSIEAYNPNTNTWSTISYSGGSALAETKLHTVTVGTDLYFVGGVSSSGVKLNRLNRWSTVNNTLTKLSGFVQGYNLFAVGYYDGKIRALFSDYGYMDHDIATNTTAPRVAFTFGAGNFGISYNVQIGKYVYYTGDTAFNLTRLDLSNMTLVTYSLPLYNAYPSGLMEISTGLLTLGNTWGGGGMSNQTCMRFVITPKVYPTNSVIIVRNSDFRGIYYTELISPDSPASGIYTFIQTGFDDVHFYGTALDKNKETYYGNGSSWIRLK